jgi:hypothetical protein
MALVVETGAGLANAEAYISVANADAYFLARANAAWALLLTADKEAALRKGADYMAQQYASRWQGVRVTSTQALDWPRSAVCAFGYSVAYTIVPAAVANANAELALKASTGELSPDIGRLKKRTKVGPLEVEYADNAPATTQYKAVDGMLAPYLNGTGGASRKVVRV